MSQVLVDLSGDASRLQRAYDVAEKSDKSLRDSLASTGKAGQTAAETISREFDQAGDKSSKAFNAMLRELRKAGPEGRKAAGEVEQHLRDTGKAGRKSMKEIVDALGMLDDEAAKVARSATADFKQVEEAGDGAFGDSAVDKVAAFAGGFLSVGAAVSTVNDFLRDQKELLEAARSAQIDLASSQSDAAKNLIGLSEIERSELLRREVPKIARDTGFSDIGGITEAIGSGRSAGGSPEQVVSAVRASAMLTALTPGAIDEYTGAAIDLSRATGLDDAKQNLGLLLTSGTQSRVTDPLALAKELAPAVNNAVAQSPEQDRVEASREAAALFSTFTQAATDTTGAPSRTATITFASELGKFFESRKELDPGTLFGRIAVLQQDEALRSEFQSKEFGEASFKTAFRDIADETSDIAEMLRNAKEAIRADAKGFAEEVKSERNLTPQLRLGMMAAQSETNLNLMRLGSDEGSRLSEVRQIVAESLAQSRAGSFTESRMQWISEVGISSGALRGSTAVEEAISGLEMLQNRRIGPLRDGVVGDEVARVEGLAGQISMLEEFVTSEAEAGRIPRSVAVNAASMATQLANEQAHAAGSSELRRAQPLQAAGYAENSQLMQRLVDVLERVANSTQQTANAAEATASNTATKTAPNYSAGLAAAAAAIVN